MDRVLERRARRTVKAVIEEDGLERFRDLETSILARLRATPAWIVVDTGGGAAVREGNRARMRELGLIIGLHASLARVTAGIAATMEKRPNQHVAPRDRAQYALRERKEAYADVDVTFEVDDHATPDETARA